MDLKKMLVTVHAQVSGLFGSALSLVFSAYLPVLHTVCLAAPFETLGSNLALFRLLF